VALLYVGYAAYYFCRSDLSVAMPQLIEDLQRHGMAGSDAVNVELPVRKRPPRVGQRKENQRRSVVTAERIWLLSPIQVSKRGGIAVVVVLCSLVVSYHDLLGRKVEVVPVRLHRKIRRSI
jgi:hypothetical protein